MPVPYERLHMEVLTMFGTNLFIAVCMYIFLPIVYITMRNNTVRKNNLILSVTIPPEAQSDKEIMDCCGKFKRNLLRAFVGLTLALVPAIFLPWVSISLTWSVIWLLVAMFVPMRVYGKSYEEMKAIKRRRGWQSVNANQVVVDLRPVSLPKRLKTGWFVPPMILSVLPVVSCFADTWEPSWHSLLAITAGCNLFTTTLSLLLYGLIFRQKKDVLDEDLELTAALTRVRRYNWTKMWLLASWFTAFYSLAVWCCQGNQTWFMIWTMVYCIALLAASVATEFAARRAQQRLTQSRTQAPIVDEDDLWVWGQFYYNPNSNKAMINERVGMGMSMNYAHPLGKAMAVFCVVALLSLPLLGVWMMTEELTPIHAEVTETFLTVKQAGTVYEIPVEEITMVRLLESLPSASRTWGTGMPNLLKGNFSVTGYGSCKLCLNPESPPFLLVMTEDQTYILGMEQAKAVYKSLSQR